MLMEPVKLLASALVTLLLAGGALAVAESGPDLPKQKIVQLSGLVKDVRDRQFTLEDIGGSSIRVQMMNGLAVREGDTVTVKGTMERGLMMRRINALEVNKKALSSTVTGINIATTHPE
jgi:hypothetical protein